MPDRTFIYDVVQQPPERTLAECSALPELPTPAGPALEPPTLALDLRQCCRDRTLLFEVRKDSPHPFGFLWVGHQPSAARSDVIPQHRASSHPFPLTPRRRHLVPGALADLLPFELSKGKQDIQR